MLTPETNKEANDMKSAKRILAVLLCAALLIGVLCACGKTAGTGADTNTNSDDSVAQQLYYADVAAPDLTNATTIALSGTDDVTITDGGVYVLTGTLTDGRVLVNAPGADVTTSRVRTAARSIFIKRQMCSSISRTARPAPLPTAAAMTTATASPPLTTKNRTPACTRRATLSSRAAARSP